MGNRLPRCAILIGFVVLMGIFSSHESDKKKAEEARAEQSRVEKMTPAERDAYNKKKAAEAAAAARKDYLQLAPFMCEEFVKKRLRDPDSAKFVDLGGSYVEDRKDGSIMTQIRGRAKNGFGGYNSGLWQCAMQPGEPSWRLVDFKVIE